MTEVNPLNLGTTTILVIPEFEGHRHHAWKTVEKDLVLAPAARGPAGDRRTRRHR